ncbi:MAG: transposase [Candidatus Contendobacter sp.]|nr:transposase [Candidatus Contendobacter sp.]
MPLFHGLAGLGHQFNPESLYIIDRFPITVGDNIRIRCCQRYQGEAWRGDQASKKRYFYGLKIHRLITVQGQPVEFFLTPSTQSDTNALKQSTKVERARGVAKPSTQSDTNALKQ